MSAVREILESAEMRRSVRAAVADFRALCDEPAPHSVDRLAAVDASVTAAARVLRGSVEGLDLRDVGEEMLQIGRESSDPAHAEVLARVFQTLWVIEHAAESSG